MRRPREVRKVLTPNDLGRTGSHQAGIAIPKDPDVLAFFPPLDVRDYNPDCTITVTTPQTSGLWELRYIYYNSKTHGQGTRNEYRLTGTTHMLRELHASVGDALTFCRSPLGDIEVQVMRPDQQSLQLRNSADIERVLKNGWRLTISDTKD